jgi:hypothetical protein
MTKHTNATIDTKLHEDGAVSHKITFADGSTDLVVIAANSPLLQQFVAHGSRAKLQAAINSASDKQGCSAPEKVASLGAAFDLGRWTLNEGTAKPKGSALTRALAALKGCPVDEAEAYVKGLSKAAQAKLRGNPAVAAKILELEADARTEATGDLLDGFLSDGVDVQEAAA